jgi:hypothetical protein
MAKLESWTKHFGTVRALLTSQKLPRFSVCNVSNGFGNGGAEANINTPKKSRLQTVLLFFTHIHSQNVGREYERLQQPPKEVWPLQNAYRRARERWKDGHFRASVTPRGTLRSATNKVWI